MKTCPKCKITKPYSAFAKHKRRYDGLQSYCRACKSTTDKSYYESNSEIIKAQKVHQARKYKYGLTEEAYVTMLEQQNGLCACCKLVPPVHVDHDHSCCPEAKTCGKCVRGLLCNKCTLFIGFIEVNPKLFDQANDYLQN